MRRIQVLLVLIFATAMINRAAASELGLQLHHFEPFTVKETSKTMDGIEKGMIQIDPSFNLGSHGPVGRKFGAGVGFRPGFTLNVDVAVHPFASVGGYFAMDGRRGVVGLGFGVRGVFHLYQLLHDKAGTKVDADVLDWYFPLHMGGTIYTGGGNSTGGFDVGGGMGIRWYFVDMFGMMFEVGWCELSVAKIGFSVKL